MLAHVTASNNLLVTLVEISEEDTIEGLRGKKALSDV